MGNKAYISSALHFSIDNDGETTKFIEIPKKTNLNFFPKFLKKMKEYDTGKLNAMLLKSKHEIFEEEVMDFVNIQSFLLYNDLLEKDNITIIDVEKSFASYN